jgi:hypothetical protein
MAPVACCPPLLLLLVALFAATAAAGRSQDHRRLLTSAEIVARLEQQQHEAAATGAAGRPPPLTAAQRAKHAAARERTLALLAATTPSAADRQTLGTNINKKKKEPDADDPDGDCGAHHKYRDRVLDALHEAPLLGLFKNLDNETKLEASGMDVVGESDMYIVFDNTPLVGLVDLEFRYEDKHDVLIEPARASVALSEEEEKEQAIVGRPRRLLGAAPTKRPRNGPADSQFEGISAIPSRPGEFIIVEETRQVHGGNDGDDKDDQGVLFSPFAQRVLVLRGQTDVYRVLERCAIHMRLRYANKGVEGIQYIEDVRGKGYLMAACEGNWCSGGAKGRERGHGKIVVLEYVPGNSTEPCGWHAVKTLDIPPGAAFTDISDVAFADPGQVTTAGPAGDPPTKGAFAALSQEDSAVWIGRFDFDAMDFDPDVAGAAFLLPRNRRCDIMYCNPEGLAFLDSDRLAIASDRAKSTQPFWCTDKDETVGVFALPDGAEKMIGGWDDDDHEAAAAEEEEAAVAVV